MNNNMEKEIFDIYVDDIIPNRFQPRLVFEEKSLNELAESIKQHGIIQPLVVRKIGDKYEIIAGERRYKASQMAGLQKVPVVIMNLDDKQSAEVAVIENIQRRDLTALEEAESYKKLLDKGYLTQEQLAARMGKAQATISNKLRLLGLDDEVKAALLNEKISERHARSLLSLKSAEEQKEVLNEIIKNKLTVRQTDELIREKLGNVATIPSDNIETLDFSSASTVIPNIVPPTPQTSLTFDLPTTPIEAPKVEEAEPNTIDNTIPFINDSVTSLDPISNIDINEIKESAVDINQVEPVADFNTLLGINSELPLKPVETAIEKPTQVADVPRFINPFDDENGENEQYDGEKAKIEAPALSFGQDLSTPVSPQTNTDSLIQEFRQNNSIVTNENKLVAGDLRSAINTVRDVTGQLEQNNFKVEVEEFDFENIYQIIIKINK